MLHKKKNDEFLIEQFWSALAAVSRDKVKLKGQKQLEGWGG